MSPTSYQAAPPRDKPILTQAAGRVNFREWRYSRTPVAAHRCSGVDSGPRVVYQAGYGHGTDLRPRPSGAPGTADAET